jgi:hypothetical protein
VSTIRNERAKSSSESSDSTIHIDETVHVVDGNITSQPPPRVQIPVSNQIDDDVASCSSSISENEESLHDEMMKLCYEIQGSKGYTASDNDDDDSSVDLTFQEEKHLRNIMDKVKTHLTMTIS